MEAKILKGLFAAVCVAACVYVASAQSHLHNGSSGLPHGIPDFCAADPMALMVPAGTTLTLSGTVVISCLGIHGTVHLNEGVRLSANQILVYDDGTLDAGQTTPVAASNPITITIANHTLNTTFDPEMFGTSLICLGICKLRGAAVTSFMRLAAEVAAGASTLTLSEVPVGWAVGQRLVLPDTRQLSASTMSPSSNGGPIQQFRLVDQSEVVSIVAISGTTVTITPTVFAHVGGRMPDGTVRFFPHVGNLTRSITVRSENPNGTRGHVLVSQRADVNFQSVAFVDLGRTSAVDPVDDTTFDSDGRVVHIGTNQKGRYPVHLHHVFGRCVTQSYQFQVTASAVENASKWAVAVHNSHFGLVQDNVVYNAGGAGIVAEDGSETANVFDRNFVVKTFNARTAGSGELNYDPQGRKGAGFWFRGPANTVTNNVVADAREGIGFYTGAAELGSNGPEVKVSVPNAPCLDTTAPANVTSVALNRRPMKVVDGNEIYSTSELGIAFWWEPAVYLQSPPISNLRLWHNWATSVFYRYADLALDSAVILNANGVGTAITQGNDGTSNGTPESPSELRNSEILGVDKVYEKTGQLGLAPFWRFTNSTFQAKSGFPINNIGELRQSSLIGGRQLSRFEWINTKWLAMPGSPLRSIQTTYLQRSPDVMLEGIRRYELIVRGYQGDPTANFRVFFTEQAPDAPAPAPTSVTIGGVKLGCPVSGLTNQQCWTAERVATLMDLATCTVNAYAEITGFACP